MKTLQKCKELAEFRSTKQSARKSIYSNIELPRGVDTDGGYHSMSHKNVTAVRIPKDSTIFPENFGSSKSKVQVHVPSEGNYDGGIFFYNGAST